MELIKFHPMKRYSVDLFLYSGPSGILEELLHFQLILSFVS